MLSINASNYQKLDGNIINNIKKVSNSTLQNCLKKGFKTHLMPWASYYLLLYTTYIKV